MVEIGQTVMCTPGVSLSDNAGAGNKRKVRGTVVYIHPAGRFYIAELDLPGGKVREAFPMTGGEPDAVTD